MFVTAMTYFAPTTTGGLFVAQRGDGTRGGLYQRNILYQFNARTGAAVSQGALRTGNNRDNPPAGTDVVEVMALGGTDLITGLASDGLRSTPSTKVAGCMKSLPLAPLRFSRFWIVMGIRLSFRAFHSGRTKWKAARLQLLCLVSTAMVTFTRSTSTVISSRSSWMEQRRSRQVWQVLLA